MDIELDMESSVLVKREEIADVGDEVIGGDRG